MKRSNKKNLTKNGLKQFWLILNRLLSYSLPWKKSLIFAIIMLLVAVISEVSGPFLIRFFIDKVLLKDRFSLKLAIELMLFYVILQFLAAGLHYVQSLLFNRAALEVVQKLRIEIVDSALRHPISEFDVQPVGQIISRVTNDTEIIRDFYVVVITTILRSLALIVVTLVAMFILDWNMALMTTVLFPSVFFVMFIYQHYSTPIVRKLRICLASINEKFNEIIIGMNVIQQFRQQAQFEKKINKISHSHYIARMKTLRLDGFLLRPLISFFSSLVLCGLLILFGFTLIGTIEIGVLYAFINYLGRLNEPLIEVATQQSILQQAIVAGERIFELMDKPHQTYGVDDFPLQSGSVIFDNVSFSYHENKMILKNINLEIPSHSFVAIVGSSGSGKSTFVNLLMGYYPLTQGKIFLDGRLINSLSHSTIRNGIAIVQQDPIVLADTFFSNVTLGRSYNREQVWSVLETVKLADLVRSMEKGIETKLNEQGNNLSVGQKQLLALARVLIEVPKLLILDEATANIDSGTEKIILMAINSIRKKLTLISIAHRLSTIIEADIILVLHHGEIVEYGTHRELLSLKGRYWKMHKVQLAKENISKNSKYFS